jgi:predicted kinase
MYIKLQKAGKIDDKYDYDLSKADDTFKLHAAVKSHGWKGKQRKLFWDQRNTDTKNLPNILWDMVSDDPEDVLEVIKYAKPCGYNITLVWVCCNIETAKQGNQHRQRRVPEKVLEAGHKGAYKCITEILSNKYPIITEGIDMAWIAFSAGYKRMLSDKFKKDEVLKVKKDEEGKFIFDKEFVDDFLKEQMPLDPDWDDKQEAEKIRKNKLISKKLNESFEQ